MKIMKNKWIIIVNMCLLDYTLEKIIFDYLAIKIYTWIWWIDEHTIFTIILIIITLPRERALNMHETESKIKLWRDIIDMAPCEPDNSSILRLIAFDLIGENYAIYHLLYDNFSFWLHHAFHTASDVNSIFIANVHRYLNELKNSSIYRLYALTNLVEMLA